MDNNERGYTRIYRYMDAPVMIGNFEVDIFATFIILAYIGNTLASGFVQWVAAIGFATGVTWLYAKYKRGAVRGKGRQLLYTLGLKKPKTVVPSNIRYFVGG